MEIEERIDFLNDLKTLVAIPSWQDSSTKTQFAPFGIGVQQCFEAFITIANNAGFKCRNVDGYALELEWGEGIETLGILCHLDTVGLGNLDAWNTPPLELTKKGDFVFGRGVNDDKGPSLAVLYVLRDLKNAGFRPNKKIKFILGGAEETTWEGMKYYLNNNPEPDLGFSADGNFPIVNCEKGIAYFSLEGSCSPSFGNGLNIVSINADGDKSKICSRCKITVSGENLKLLEKLENYSEFVTHNNVAEITYIGKEQLSRNPHKGVNAICKMAEDFVKLGDNELITLLSSYFVNNEKANSMGLYYCDEITGNTTSNISSLVYNGNKVQLAFDYRYPYGVDFEQSVKHLATLFHGYKLEILQHRPIHYVKEDSYLIKTLSEAYKMAMVEYPELCSKAAASYARVMENCVAYGPTFCDEVPNCHMPNEKINLKNLEKAMEVYKHAIMLLTKEK